MNVQYVVVVLISIQSIGALKFTIIKRCIIMLVESNVNERYINIYFVLNINISWCIKYQLFLCSNKYYYSISFNSFCDFRLCNILFFSLGYYYGSLKLYAQLQ